jgi:hypothetical protein
VELFFKNEEKRLEVFDVEEENKLRLLKLIDELSY